MNELRQRVPANEEVDCTDEKDELSALKFLLRKVIIKKYNDKHFRHRFTLYLGLATLLTLYFSYQLTLSLQCDAPESIPAYAEPQNAELVYFHAKLQIIDAQKKAYYLQRHRLDKFRSDAIPLNRKLADYRPEVCKIRTYHKTSLKISIVIVLDSAPPSVILRTVYSAVARTKKESLAEIIVYSPKGTLDFSEYASLYSVSHVVKIISSPIKRTLSAARNEAAIAAKGDVLVFLPEATEILPGWAEPLLDAMSQNPATLAGLAMDEINGETFEQVEHVPWHLISIPRWDYVSAVPIELPPHEHLRLQLHPYPDSTPVRTPVLQFQPWAANRQEFLTRGGLDEGMIGSSHQVFGDLTELSIRWWNCDGEVVYLPCSKVAPVSLLSDPNHSEIQFKEQMLYNSRRTAGRWGAGHMSYYLDKVPAAKRVSSSQSTRLEGVIRELSCRSLSWYISNVAVDWVFGDKLYKRGSIKHAHSDACVDNMGHDGRYSAGRPEFYGCHSGYTQHWHFLSYSKQIRTETGKCLMSDQYWHDVLTLDYCSVGHAWRWQPLQGSNVGYLVYKDLCLEYSKENSVLFIKKCNESERQQFIFEVVSVGA